VLTWPVTRPGTMATLVSLVALGIPDTKASGLHARGSHYSFTRIARPSAPISKEVALLTRVFSELTPSP